MLTKKDRQQLIKEFKQVFPTKNDLDRKLRNQLRDQTNGILAEVRKRLEQLRKDISLDVGNLLIEGPLKTLAEHEDRFDKLEKHTGISSESP